MKRLTAVVRSHSCAGSTGYRSTRSPLHAGRSTKEYIGIDMHMGESQICMLTEHGEILERRFRTQLFPMTGSPSGWESKTENSHPRNSHTTPARRLIGWDRYDGLAALQLLNDLYRHEQRLLLNRFQPSVKLLRNERVGSKLRRVHDAPRTPLERLQAYAQADPKNVAKLIALRVRTEPFELARTITDRLKALDDAENRRKASKTGRHRKRFDDTHLGHLLNWLDRARGRLTHQAVLL